MPISLQTKYVRIYFNIVFVSSVLLCVAGVADIVVSCFTAASCVDNFGLIPLMLMALGVLTIMTGILFVYVIGILMDFPFILFFSNIRLNSFKWSTWSFAAVTYMIGAYLCINLQSTVSSSQDANCANLHRYVGFRVFATIAVPVSPIVLVLFALGIFLALYVLYCFLLCFCSSTDD